MSTAQQLQGAALECGVDQVCRAASPDMERCSSPQVVIAVAEKYMRSADPSYPVGRTRLETVGVVACAVIMTIATIEVIQAAAGDLVDGLAKGGRSCWTEAGAPNCSSHRGCGAAAQQWHGSDPAHWGMHLLTSDCAHRRGAHEPWLADAGQLPELQMTVLMYIILGSATGIKILLFIYCYALKTQSGGVLQSLACLGSTGIPS